MDGVSWGYLVDIDELSTLSAFYSAENATRQMLNRTRVLYTDEYAREAEATLLASFGGSRTTCCLPGGGGPAGDVLICRVVQLKHPVACLSACSRATYDNVELSVSRRFAGDVKPLSATHHTGA